MTRPTPAAFPAIVPDGSIADAFAVGSIRWPGIARLIAEGAHVLRAGGKLIDCGGLPPDWDVETFAMDIGSLLAAVDYVVAKNPELSPTVISTQRAERFAQFTEWHEAQQRKAQGL